MLHKLCMDSTVKLEFSNCHFPTSIYYVNMQLKFILCGKSVKLKDNNCALSMVFLISNILLIVHSRIE